jgi:hypothetical protein
MPTGKPSPRIGGDEEAGPGAADDSAEGFVGGGESAARINPVASSVAATAPSIVVCIFMPISPRLTPPGSGLSVRRSSAGKHPHLSIGKKLGEH